MALVFSFSDEDLSTEQTNVLLDCLKRWSYYHDQMLTGQIPFHMMPDTIWTFQIIEETLTLEKDMLVEQASFSGRGRIYVSVDNESTSTVVIVSTHKNKFDAIADLVITTSSGGIIMIAASSIISMSFERKEFIFKERGPNEGQGHPNTGYYIEGQVENGTAPSPGHVKTMVRNLYNIWLPIRFYYLFSIFNVLTSFLPVLFSFYSME